MNLEKILEEVVSIPPAPQILPRLQSSLRDPDADLEDITKLLKADISITAEILKLANSMYFNFANPVTSLEQAISLMGFREIYKIASIAAAGTTMKEALPFYNADEGEFLAHSVATALIMTAIAEVGGWKEVDSHYTIGLLHGVGKIVINKYFLSRGLSVFGSNSHNGEDAHEITLAEERQMFGFDHTEAGAALLVKWKFSSDIVTPIRFRNEPDKAGDVACVTTALNLSSENALHLIRGEENLEAWNLPERIGMAQFGKDDLDKVIVTANKKYSEFNSLLGTYDSSDRKHLVV